FLFPLSHHIHHLHSFPTRRSSDLLIKNAFLIMIISPGYSFLIIVSLVSVYFIMKFIPALFFIFGGITYAFITTWLGLHAFNNVKDRKSTRLNSSHVSISYAVFCLK